VTTTERLAIPDHVPQDLVVDFDIRTDPIFQGDPQAGLYSLRGRTPMFFTPRSGGHWVVLDGGAMTEVYQDTERFTAKGSLERAPDGAVQIPMGLDPPELLKYRVLLARLLSARAMNELADSIRSLAIELIDRVRDNGACEFVSEVAELYPVTIFLRQVDFPLSELPRFRRWAKAMFHDPDPAKNAEAVFNITNYLSATIKDRRGTHGTDLLSQLLQSQVADRALNGEEMLSIMFTIFGGGLDTVVSTLSFIIRFLAGSPAHRDQLIAEPALIPQALEELMRRHSITSLFRLAKHDMEFHGVRLRAGDRLWCSTVMIGLDEKRIPEPLTVDFHRAKAGNPIFGVGPHHCPGRYLARLELRIFLEEWLRRIPHFAVEPNSVIPILTGPAMGLGRLPLRWNHRAALATPQSSDGARS
jgi:cytochrome P450